MIARKIMKNEKKKKLKKNWVRNAKTLFSSIFSSV
jgi:hypothetical protein